MPKEKKAKFDPGLGKKWKYIQKSWPGKKKSLTDFGKKADRKSKWKFREENLDVVGKFQEEKKG